MLDIELFFEEVFKIVVDKFIIFFLVLEIKVLSLVECVFFFKIVDEKCLSKFIISCFRCVLNSIFKIFLYNFIIR